MNIVKTQYDNLNEKNFITFDLYLNKFIKEEWIYNYESPINPIQLTIKYLKNSNNVNFENYVIEDTLESAFQKNSIMSDAEIILRVSTNILFKNNKDRISILKVNSQNYIGNEKEYIDLCSTIRKKYEIIKIEPLSLDDIFLEISSLYFSRFIDKREILEKEIYRLAYHSETGQQFKKSISLLCNKTAEQKQILYMKDGYVASLEGSIESPKIIISCLSYNFLLHGYKPKSLLLSPIITLKNEYFWEEAWYEFLLKYEDSLEFLNNGNSNKEQKRTKCSEKYNMTHREIAKQMEIRYGLKVTEATIGNIEKRGLRKIESKFASLGISTEDYGIISEIR